MSQRAAHIILALFFLAILAIPALWVYATVSTCGWKGIFIECRITTQSKNP